MKFPIKIEWTWWHFPKCKLCGKRIWREKAGYGLYANPTYQAGYYHNGCDFKKNQVK